MILFSLFNLFGLILLVILGLVVGLCAYLFSTSYSHKREKDSALSPVFWGLGVASFGAIFGLPLVLFFDMMSFYEVRSMPVGFDFYSMKMVLCYLYLLLALSLLTIFFRRAYKNLAGGEQVGWSSCAWTLSKFVAVYGGLLALVFFKDAEVGFRLRVSSVDVEGLQLSSSDSFVLENTELFRMMVAPSFAKTLVLVPGFWIGLAIFAVFGAAGMAVVPTHLLSIYFYRPKVAHPETHVLTKQVLLETNSGLLARSKEMFALRAKLSTLRAQGLKGEVALNERLLSSQLIAMQEDAHNFTEMKAHFDAIENIQDENPLFYLLSLVAGLVLGLFSVLFLFALFSLLNESGSTFSRFFDRLESFSDLLALAVFALFVGYSQFAVLKGLEKFALMFPKFLPFLPLRSGKTWTGDLLAAACLVMLSTPAILAVNMLIFGNLFRFTSMEFLMMQVVGTGVGFFLIEQNLIAYTFVFVFFIAIFIAYFVDSGPSLIAEKVQFMRLQVEKKKKKEAAGEPDIVEVAEEKEPEKEREVEAQVKAPEPQMAPAFGGFSDLF